MVLFAGFSAAGLHRGQLENQPKSFKKDRSTGRQKAQADSISISERRVWKIIILFKPNGLTEPDKQVTARASMSQHEYEQRSRTPVE